MYKNSILNPSSLPTPHSGLEYLGDIFCLCSMDGGIVSTSSFPLFQIAIYLTEEELMGWLIEQAQHLNSQFRGVYFRERWMSSVSAFLIWKCNTKYSKRL